MPAFYRASLAQFLADDSERILGLLVAGCAGLGFAELKQKQTKAWQKQIAALKTAGTALASIPGSTSWSILLEYPIPRRQKRIDTILLASDVIFCLEFKTEDKAHTRQAQQQAEDYALDLRDFHEQSRGRRIVPVVVALRAEAHANERSVQTADPVRLVVLACASDLAQRLASAIQEESRLGSPAIDAAAWDMSAYRPVPTIVEAAEALFAGHNVREIAHSHAGATNLSATSDKLVEIIQRAQREGLKVACFVTGVPGAGKTLAGLNVVHNPVLRHQGRPPGVFLSGNGPLVKIVSAAIARDFRRRTNAGGAERTSRTFIQNVHAFVREALDKPDKPPAESVIVFDEAQRAWDAAHNARKTGSELSEPETVLSIMDRHRDWAVIVALVGGGQEIHNGEAGLAEWGRSLRERFPQWQIAVSPQALFGDASLSGHRLFPDVNRSAVSLIQEPALHLQVNVRSFRAQRLVEWVEAVLAGDPSRADAIVHDLQHFPLALTRSLATARTWLRQHARGLRRSGLVASSGAIRLRPDGLELSSGFRQGNRDLYVHWFLAEPSDVRSSNQLEVAASEFECQGLELDWVGVCWGGDFTWNVQSGAWCFRNFSGNRWSAVSKQIDQQYLLNSYRVLMTRAREGMVIWVPPGDANDATRSTSEFNAIADYLIRCGLPTA